MVVSTTPLQRGPSIQAGGCCTIAEDHADTRCGREAAVPPGFGKRTTHRRRALRRRAERIAAVPEGQYIETEQDREVYGDILYNCGLLPKAFYTWCSITGESVEAASSSHTDPFPGIAVISDTEADKFGDFLYTTALMKKVFNIWCADKSAEQPVQQLNEIDGEKLKAVSKEDLDIGGKMEELVPKTTGIVKQRIAFWSGRTGVVEMPEVQYVKKSVAVPAVPYEERVDEVTQARYEDRGFTGEADCSRSVVMNINSSATGLGTCRREKLHTHTPLLVEVPEVQYVDTTSIVPQDLYEEVAQVQIERVMEVPEAQYEESVAKATHARHVDRGGHVGEVNIYSSATGLGTCRRENLDTHSPPTAEVPEVQYVETTATVPHVHYEIERAVEVHEAPYFERIVEVPYAKHTTLASDGITRSVTAVAVSDCGFAGGVESRMVEVARYDEVRKVEAPEDVHFERVVEAPQVRYEGRLRRLLAGKGDLDLHYEKVD